MPTNLFKPRSLSLISVLIPLLGVAPVVGCGGDDDDTGNEAGSGGTAGKGGSGGKGGSAGKGGSSGSAGKGGSSGATGKGGSGGKGSGGSAGSGTSGSGGESAGAGGDDSFGGEGGGSAGQEPVGGAGGEDSVGGQGGEGPGPVTFKAITRLNDILIAGVNDLRGIAFAANGKIYASGHVGVNTDVDRETAIVRFNDDGTLDNTFGTAGIVRINVVPRVVDSTGEAPVVVNNGTEESLGIVELASGEFVLQINGRDATGTGVDVLLLKVNAAGERVAGFGTNGVKRVDFGWIDETDNASWPTAGATPSDQAWGLRVDSSVAGTEKLVVFGFGPAKKGSTSGNPATQRVDNDRYVTRVLASTGAIDPGFNGGAVYTLNSGGTFSDGGRRGIVLADGTILSSGYTNFGEGLGNHVILIKLKPDGTPDATFRYGINAPGASRFNPFLTDGGVAECYNVARQSTGRLVTTGYGRATAANTISSYGYATTSNVDIVSFGVLPSGAVDTSFGIESTVALQSELFAGTDFEDRGRDLLALPDNRLIYVGKFGANPSIHVAKPDGSLDEGSGDAANGLFTYTPLVRVADPNAVPPVTALATSHFYVVEASADGKTIAAATANHEFGSRIAFLTVAD